MQISLILASILSLFFIAGFFIILIRRLNEGEDSISSFLGALFWTLGIAGAMILLILIVFTFVGFLFNEKIGIAERIHWPPVEVTSNNCDAEQLTREEVVQSSASMTDEEAQEDADEDAAYPPSSDSEE
jgi:hypothetical protein